MKRPDDPVNELKVMRKGLFQLEKDMLRSTSKKELRELKGKTEDLTAQMKRIVADPTKAKKKSLDFHKPAEWLDNKRGMLEKKLLHFNDKIDKKMKIAKKENTKKEMPKKKRGKMNT